MSDLPSAAPRMRPAGRRRPRRQHLHLPILAAIAACGPPHDSRSLRACPCVSGERVAGMRGAKVAAAPTAAVPCALRGHVASDDRRCSMRATTGRLLLFGVLSTLLALAIGGAEVSAVSASADTGTIMGSGKVVSQIRTVSSFDKLSVGGIGTVVLTQGKSPSLTVEAEDNLQPYLSTEVTNSTLRIGVHTPQGQSITATKPIRYLLTVPKLTRVDLSGAIALETTTFKSDSFTLNLSGSGSAKLTHFQATSFTAVITGAGEISISGQVRQQTINISGAGRYTANDLTSSTAKIDVSGAGSATVNVHDSLDATVSGAGSILYAGHPQVTQNVSGAGSVQATD